MPKGPPLGPKRTAYLRRRTVTMAKSDHHPCLITTTATWPTMSTASSSVTAVNTSGAAPSTSQPTLPFPVDSAAPSQFERLVVTAVTKASSEAYAALHEATKLPQYLTSWETQTPHAPPTRLPMAELCPTTGGMAPFISTVHHAAA